MRQIGTVPSESQAKTLVDYLLTLGIEGNFEPQGTKYEIWIRDEDHLINARQILSDFLRSPDDPTYQAAARTAEDIRREKEKIRKAAAQKQVSMSKTWSRGTQAQGKPVTLSLLAISVIVALLTSFGDTTQRAEKGGLTFGQKVLFGLTFLDYPGVQMALLDVQTEDKPASFPNRLLKSAAANSLENGRILEDAPIYRTWSLLHFEFWRLFTPCFVHFGMLHLVFNMWMLFNIGSLLEPRVGTTRYLIFVLICGIVPNIVQGMMPQALDGSLVFGGMSGVLFGLFGWTLMRQQMGRSQGIHLSPFSIVLLLGWLVAGFLHIVPGIANWCHGIGFLVGLIAGFLPSILKRR